QPPNVSWPLSQNGSDAEATLAANLTFSSYYQHSCPVAAMFIVAYVLIFVLCMVGNTLVCFTVLKNRHMRTVTNMFILNLAVSDLLVGIFCMPTTLVDNLITGWPFDNATCKMSGLVQGMSVSASVFTLVAIAVERDGLPLMHPAPELSEPQLHLLSVYAFPLAHWLAFFHSSANPIIYGYFNENFRRGFQAAFRAQLCRPPWGAHKQAYSERPGRLLRRRMVVDVQPSDSGLPSESGPSSGAPGPGRLPLRNGRVANQDGPQQGPGCNHVPLTIPAWNI
ncbi:Neuropeptide FF receptor 1, partial [Cricetulus griseus]